MLNSAFLNLYCNFPYAFKLGDSAVVASSKLLLIRPSWSSAYRSLMAFYEVCEMLHCPQIYPKTKVLCIDWRLECSLQLCVFQEKMHHNRSKFLWVRNVLVIKAIQMFLSGFFFWQIIMQLSKPCSAFFRKWIKHWLSYSFLFLRVW